MDLGTLSLGDALSPITRVRRLFTAGETGVWYDPSDLGTLFQDSAGTTPVTAAGQPVGKILDKSGNGYHATQATSTARSILGRHPISGRRNRLTYTEDFGNAAWLTHTQYVLTANSAQAPDGSSTFWKFNKTGTSEDVFRMGFTVAAGIAYSAAMTFYVLKDNDETRFPELAIYASGTGLAEGKFWQLNTKTGATALRAVAGSPALNTITVTDTGLHWKVQIAFTSALTTQTLIEWVVRPVAGTVFGVYDAAATGITYAGWPQLELGSTPTAYQKVTSTYDVTEAGVNDAYYIDDDGVDDAAAQADGGGGTTGFFLCAAVRPDGGAGAIRTIWSDAGTNTGYIVRLNALNQLEIAAGNGTAYTLAATTATLTVGTTYVVTAWDDGTNLNVQVNSGTAGTAARPVVSAGTTTATIGKDNGAATGMFNGAIYPLVYVKNGQNVDALDRAAVKSYVAGMAGVGI